MKIFYKLGIFTILCALAGSACGSGSNSAKFSNETACKVLTAKEAAQFLHGPAGKGSFVGGTQTKSANTSQCSYITRSGVLPDDVLSLVIQRESNRSQSATEILSTLRTNTYNGDKTKDIHGLGKGALLATTATAQQLNVLTGKDYFVISAGLNKNQKDLEKLAHTILDQLTKVSG